MQEIVSTEERNELAQHEGVIERGLKTFVDVGNALLAIRDKRLYRQDHGTFEGYCRERWGMERAHAYRLIDSAQVVANLSPIGDKLPTTESQVRPLTNLEPEQQVEVWQRAVETAPNGKVTASHVETVKRDYLGDGAPNFVPPVAMPTYWTPDATPAATSYEAQAEKFAEDEAGYDWVDESLSDNDVTGHRGYIPPVASPKIHLAAANHAVSDTPGYDGDEWYTPSEYIEAARAVMGSIDLDPASCEAAQVNVCAGSYYTKDNDGLSEASEWYGNVWLNPPYSMPLVARFVDRLISEYESGKVHQAVIITNNSSDTRWFHELINRYPACFPRGRVQFWRPDHDAFGARQGQTLFYLGDRVHEFCQEFSGLGAVVKRI